MSGHGKHAKGHGHERADRDHDNGGNAGADDGQRRTVDEDVPAPRGLTSPGEGADEAPAESRQSKDYT